MNCSGISVKDLLGIATDIDWDSADDVDDAQQSDLAGVFESTLTILLRVPNGSSQLHILMASINEFIMRRYKRSSQAYSSTNDHGHCEVSHA